jgi:hypothetical protein
LSLDKPEEIESVTFTNTITNPWAMMVVGSNAMIALFAMFTAKWLFYVANGAVLVFNEQNQVFFGIIILIWQSIFKFYDNI